MTMTMKRFFVLFAATALLSLTAAARDEGVAPLLDGWVRHQDAPFNLYCPTYTNDKGEVSEDRCIVGCVATALESIISYYRRPVVLQDVLPAWSTEHFTTTDIPAGTTIDTRLILPDYGDGTAESVGMDETDYAASVDAVAQLSLLCGMAAQMKWGLESSGANTENVIEPLQKVFGWKRAVILDSYQYTPEQWRNILKNELRHGRPILYTGYTMNLGGHAFVIDGYDENDLFHVNWGYGGPYDNYWYDLTELCAFRGAESPLPEDVLQGFHCNQQALLLSPDEVEEDTAVADSLDRSGQEIVIEDVSIDESPLTGKQTPITLTLCNTADCALTTPFEIFTNLPETEEEKWLEEGDYGCLFGVTLAPGERRTVTVHPTFEETGERILRISPDDEAILCTLPLNIGKGETDRLTFHTPTVTLQPAASGKEACVDATFTVTLDNAGGQRSGSTVTYCLMPETEVVRNGDDRHYAYVYLAPNGQTTHHITYHDLPTGSVRLFAVRHPWGVQQEYLLEVPDDLSGVSAPVTLSPMSDTLYDLHGRRGRQPQGGLLIRGQRKMISNHKP